MSDWKSNLTDLIPYEAGIQIKGDDIIKLNANENPYPPSPQTEKILKNFDPEDLKKYPTLGISFLDEAIADFHKVKNINVLSGNSSDEILAMCFRAFFNSEKPILFADITYSFYPVWCDFYNIPYEKIPVNKFFEINIKDYISKNNGGIIIPNPNAPTGIEMSLDNIEELLSENQSSVVVIDEAYSDFGNVSAVELVNRYENLLVTKTMSKSRSLAGLRVGYAIGSRLLIDALRASMHSFNAYPLSSLSIKIAESSVKDNDYFLKTVNQIKKTREKTKQSLLQRGFEMTDSMANFLFITHNKIKASDLYKFLLERKILVRHFDKPKTENYLRVSVGTEYEMGKFLEVVDEYMEENNVI